MIEPKTHIVKRGESLYSIAKTYQTTVKHLMELNNLHNTILQIGQVLLISDLDPINDQKINNYQDFLNKNLGIGILKIQTLIGNTFFPIENVLIEVYKEFNGLKKTFYSGKTEESGLIDNIKLPCPLKQIDYLNKAAIYQIKATHPNFQTVLIDEVSLYDGIKSIQKIEMLPNSYIFEKEKANGK